MTGKKPKESIYCIFFAAKRKSERNCFARKAIIVSRPLLISSFIITFLISWVSLLFAKFSSVKSNLFIGFGVKFSGVKTKRKRDEIDKSPS